MAKGDVSRKREPDPSVPGQDWSVSNKIGAQMIEDIKRNNFMKPDFPISH